jgi:hypothetical protein
MTAPSICRHCGEEIVWAITETGATMPVELEPTDDGNMVLFTEIDGLGDVLVADDASGEVQRVRLADDVDRLNYAGRLWRSHWRSCPEAYARRARQHTEGPGT